MQKKLGFFARGLIYCKQNLTEQIVFISSEKYLRKIGLEMQAGKTVVYSKFERKMLSDIRDLRLQGVDMKTIKIENMKRTSELVKFGKLFQ